MPDLSTTYLGLSLRNPLVVSSSKLTATLEDVEACEKAGAGAVVLKSLFEEQILADIGDAVDGSETMLAHSESMDFFSGMGESYYMNAYLSLVRQCKESLSIPVIPSINCVSSGTWLEYTKSFVDVGADALELNYFVMPGDINKEGSEIEQMYIDFCRKIKQRVSIPISMKIGPYFSGLAHMTKRLTEEGMEGLVLFNRFYRPDVDIEKLQIKAAPIISRANEISQSLQWIAMLSGDVECDLAASTGVHDAEGFIKQLLVGAKVVQMCSALLKNGVEYIQTVLSGLQEWMQKHGYESIDDFRGKLNRVNIEDPKVYERSQYVKALVGIW